MKEATNEKNKRETDERRKMDGVFWTASHEYEHKGRISRNWQYVQHSQIITTLVHVNTVTEKQKNGKLLRKTIHIMST